MRSASLSAARPQGSSSNPACSRASAAVGRIRRHSRNAMAASKQRDRGDRAERTGVVDQVECGNPRRREGERESQPRPGPRDPDQPRRGCGGGGSPGMREFRSCPYGHARKVTVPLMVMGSEAGQVIYQRRGDLNRQLVLRPPHWRSAAHSLFLAPDRQSASPMTDREKNRFSARAARYARVGANVGGVAAKIAATRFFGLDARSRQERDRARGGARRPEGPDHEGRPD